MDGRQVRNAACACGSEVVRRPRLKDEISGARTQKVRGDGWDRRRRPGPSRTGWWRPRTRSRAGICRGNWGGSAAAAPVVVVVILPRWSPGVVRRCRRERRGASRTSGTKVVAIQPQAQVERRGHLGPRRV